MKRDRDLPYDMNKFEVKEKGLISPGRFRKEITQQETLDPEDQLKKETFHETRLFDANPAEPDSPE